MIFLHTYSHGGLRFIISSELRRLFAECTCWIWLRRNLRAGAESLARNGHPSIWSVMLLKCCLYVRRNRRFQVTGDGSPGRPPRLCTPLLLSSGGQWPCLTWAFEYSVLLCATDSLSHYVIRQCVVRPFVSYTDDTWLILRHCRPECQVGRRMAVIIVQELCESRGGRPGLSVPTSLLVSVDVKLYWTMIRHWSQLVPNMSADIRGH